MWEALSSRLRRPSRFFTVLVILAVNAAIVAAVWSPPEPKPAIDWSGGPFYGPQQVSAWIASLDTPLMFPGRVRAHRVWVALTACAVVALLFRGGAPSWGAEDPRSQSQFITPRLLFSSVLSATVLVLALLLIATTTLASLTKTPDLSRLGSSDLHVALSHYDLLAPADHVAVGDKLFVDVIPAYGVLWPVFVGAYQRWFGLCSLGTIIKIMFTINAAGISLFAVTMYRWARGCLICWTPPLAFVCGYYLPLQRFLIPPNHCLIRTGALLVAPVAWALATRLPAFTGSVILGALSAASLALNFEVGFAVMTGSLAAAAFQWAFPIRKTTRLYAGVLQIVGGLFVGGAIVIIAVALVGIVALGQYIPLLDIVLPSRFAAATSGAYLTCPPHRWVVPLLCVMLVHAAGTLLFLSAAPLRSRRHSVRAGVCTALLVWIAYPVNRPHTEYLYSTYFLYGFLLVDTVRTLRSSVLYGLKRKLTIPRPPTPIGASALMVTLFAGLWLLMRLDVSQRGGDRWAAPLVRCSPEQKLTSGVLLSDQSQDAENTRASFIAQKSRDRGGRVVFVSSDAFVISRIAGTVPAQPFSEPALCVTRSMYEDYVSRVGTLAPNEFYMDTRNTTQATWWGFVNDMARQDFSLAFERVGFESGWEIWRRRR